jgi:hypothetical protein
MSKRETAMLAAWGSRPQPRTRLVAWKPVTKGALRGFATVELPIGLKLIDCPVLVGPNGAWATLPSKPVLDSDGKQLKPGGKAQYTAIMQWRDRDLTDRFSQAVVALVRKAHPEALDATPP